MPLYIILENRAIGWIAWIEATGNNTNRPLLDRILRIEIHSHTAESAADYTLDRVRRPDVLLFETPADFAASSLPNTPDRAAINRILIEILAAFSSVE